MPDGWIEFARVVWELGHGKVPTGLLIHHRDRDTLNDVLSNLEILTRAEHLNEHRSEIVAGRQS